MSLYHGIPYLYKTDRLDPRVNVLRLLADGRISVGKACEALNEIMDGKTPLLPTDDTNEHGTPEDM